MRSESRLKRYARIIAGQSPPSSQVGDLDDHGLPFLQGNAEFTTTSPVPAHACDSARKKARAGDILLSVRAPVGALNIADQTYGIGRGLCAIRGTRADQRFLWWALHRSVADLQSRATGSTYEAVSVEDVADTLIPTPQLTEQRAIADYLDTETNRIDTLITKKRRMLELLRHRLVSFATHLVNGEDPSQGSGIPSIPRIPRRWRSLRNKVFMHETNERSSTGDEELLSVSHLTGVTPRSEKTVYMFKAESMIGYKLVQPGDLAVNTMWAWMGAAGVSRHHGIVSPSYGVYRIDQSIVLPEYFDLLVRTPAYVCEMTRYSRGVTSSRLRLYPDELLALRTPVPPIVEQKAAVRRFERKADAATSAINALERQVDLLTERRQALITAAVTGELAVSGGMA